MAPPPLARSGAPRLDLIAASWGGLAASVGLMVGGGRDWPARLIITAAAFFAAGFLASMRSGRSTLLHALIAVLAAYAIHAVFVGLASLIHRAGGPSAPPLVPGDDGRDWLIAAGWAIAFAVAGALLARALLRPQSRRRSFGST